MIRLIAAIDRSRGIAKGGLQPWRIPEDELYFRDTTHKFGGNLLMGSRTHEVIGHALPGRRNLVLSHQEDKQYENVEMIRNLDDFLRDFTEDLWVIGGGSVYEQMVDKADELYLTHIEADFGCDLLFPDYAGMFKMAEEGDLREQNGFIYKHCIFKP